MKRYILYALVFGSLIIAGCANDSPAQSDFTATVEVLSGSPTPLSPVAWAVHTGDNPFFTPETNDRVDGLEALAEDGNAAPASTAIASRSGVLDSGLVDTPDGAASAGPATPGHSFTLEFTAEEGEKLSFASMFGQSNDLFFSPKASGIELFSDSNPVSGDVTSQIVLWDAGTEVNEQPGQGPNQAPRQSAPNTGPDENANVRPVSEVNDGFSYQAVSAMIKVTITPK